MATQDTLVCPEGDCDGTAPLVENSECGAEIKYGEIAYVVLGNEGQPFINWTDAAEISSRLDNDDISDPSKLRIFQVVGSMTTEFGELKQIHGGQFAAAKNTTTLEMKIFHNSDVNYDATRSLGCSLPLRAWPITSDGDWYGGNSGIKIIFQGKEDVPESRDDFRTLSWRGQYKSQLMQLRTEFPLAFDDVSSV